MNGFLANAKQWRTSLVGALSLLAMLPQNTEVAHLMSINPKIAGYLTIVGTVAAAGVLIFGATDPVKPQA